MRTIAEVDDFKLLRRFVEAGSQAAFSELVSRHIDMVYSVCLRETQDAALAQDVTQAVFLILFRKARSMRRGTVIAGWLFHTARLASSNARRSQARRRAMEAAMQQVLADDIAQASSQAQHWDAIEPMLHEAVASLGVKDRDAILMRYFEDRSLREVAQSLGTTEKAAQMRVARALEKLRKYLHQNGVSAPLAMLGALLLENAVRAAPASCAQSVAQVFAGSTAVKSHLISQEVTKSMFVSKLKAASLIAALGAAGVVGAAYFSGVVLGRAAETARPIPAPDPAWPSGEEILQKSEAAYKALPTYVGKMTAHTESIALGEAIATDSTADIEFRRPNSLRMSGLDTEGEPYTFVYDGQVGRLNSTTDGEKQLEQGALDDVLPATTGATGAPLTVTALLLDAGWGHPFGKPKDAKLEGSEDVDGAKCYRVSKMSFDKRRPSSWRKDTFWVDSKTLLLRRRYTERQYPPDVVDGAFYTVAENFTTNSAS